MLSCDSICAQKGVPDEFHKVALLIVRSPDSTNVQPLSNILKRYMERKKFEIQIMKIHDL